MNGTLHYKKVFFVASAICNLISALLSTKESQSGSPRPYSLSEGRKTHSSSSSSDKQITKLQLGPSFSLAKIRTSSKISKQLDSQSHKIIPGKIDSDNKQIQFEFLNKPIKRKSELLQLFERQKRPKKGRLLGRISRARKFPLRAISTDKWDQEKLKKKLLDNAKNRKQSLIQVHETKDADTIPTSINSSIKKANTYDKASQLATDRRLGKSSTRSEKSSTDALIATKSSSGSGDQSKLQ